MSIDDYKLDREDDGRYSLTPEEEKEVLEDLENMERREVGAKWGISQTKIHWLLNPEKYKEQLVKNKKNKVYDKQKAKEYKRRNRAKKYELREKGGNS